MEDKFEEKIFSFRGHKKEINQIKKNARK